MAVLILVFMFFIKKYSSKRDDSFESKSTTLIKASVKVYKNDYGVPHIIAQNENDAFFAIGYCQAQDRLWQMDYLRRMASGRLAEIFGRDFIDNDKFARVIGFRKIAESIYYSMDLKTKDLLIKYCEGVNFYIREHKDNLSFEFGALGDTIEDWHPVDCLSITRLLAFEMSQGFYVDIAFGEVAAICGDNKAMELVPGYPEDAPFVTDTLSEPIEPGKKSFFRSMIAKNNASYKNKDNYRMLAEFSKSVRKVRKAWGMAGNLAGSNSWAIIKPFKDSTRTEALLANDPHLSLGLPARWYQYHVSCPEFNAVGLSLPGVPFLMIGRNNYISWGITNAMLDDCDFFVVPVDSNNQDIYIDENGKMKKFTYIRDTIKIKSSEPIEYYIRKTERSAVISDWHLFRKPSGLPEASGDSSAYLSKNCLIYSWLGSYYSNECLASYNILKSRNWVEFKEALKSWGVPAFNFTYADIKGNIGISPTGMMAIRNKNNPNLPTSALSPDCFWTGVDRTNTLPDVFNPLKKYVVSANNCITRNYPGYLTSYWEPPSRAERITELLMEYMSYRTGYSARDGQIMQNDVVSPYAKQFLAIALPVIERNSRLLFPAEKSALKALKDWDCLMSKQLPASSIYNTMFERLVFNTFYDNLGAYVYREYTYVPAIPTRRLMELMQENNIYWFDDITSTRNENRDYMIFRSFRDAVKTLAILFDTDDCNKWEYGRMHTLVLKHPLMAIGFLDKSLNVGPLKLGGNNTTINCTAYNIFQPFDVTVGASGRFIADMNSDCVYSIIPGGTSGSITDRNYSDQVQLWLNGGYLELPVGPDPGASFELSIVIEKE